LNGALRANGKYVPCLVMIDSVELSHGRILRMCGLKEGEAMKRAVVSEEEEKRKGKTFFENLKGKGMISG